LFVDDGPVNVPAAKIQAKPVMDSIRYSDDIQVEQKKEENTLVQQ